MRESGGAAPEAPTLPWDDFPRSFVVTAVILGLMHQCEIGGGILIVIVKMF